MNKYVVTDLHGCLKTFKALLSRLSFSRDDKLFVLGDLIDRGPDSKGVIDFIWQLEAEQYQVQCIRGNHDQLMLDATQSVKWNNMWLANGGYSALVSFNALSMFDIPDQYFAFIRDMPYYLEEDEYLLVHAGFNFKAERPFEDTNAMMWIRRWYEQMDYDLLQGRKIVHGHTPISRRESMRMMDKLDRKQVLNLDTGCVYND